MSSRLFNNKNTFTCQSTADIEKLIKKKVKAFIRNQKLTPLDLKINGVELTVYSRPQTGQYQVYIGGQGAGTIKDPGPKFIEYVCRVVNNQLLP